MATTYNNINEKVYSHICKSGLRTCVIPKDGFDKTYALFATNFGSVDSHFFVGDKEVIIPDGVAHFLEHKMFEQPDGNDAFTLFSKYGAQANAFTAFDMTAYLFSTSNNFNECLEHLLSFVSTPFFTEQNVAKEQGIISQEIKMYDDDPSWNVFFNMLRALYEKHPINIDIAGSVQSISEITPDILYDCYHAYYNPKNMFLCVVGKVDPDEVFTLAEKVVPTTDFEVGKTVVPDEKSGVNKVYTERKMEVSLPLFTVGYKEKIREDKLYAEALYSVVLDAIMGKSSPLYNELYKEGLITSLSSAYNYGKQYAFVEIGGESPKPKAVYERIEKCIAECKNSGIDAMRIEISKKALYGRYIKGLNSLERMAQGYITAAFSGEDYFTYGDKLLSVTKEDADKLVKDSFLESALSVVFGGNEK